MKVKLIKTEVNYLLKNEEGVIIASTSLKKEGLALSLKNCQVIELGYDLDELTKEQYPIDEPSFKRGFKLALEILGDKKFTYNQMVSAITESSISYRLPSLIIQDLQQTEWDVEIVMENKPYKYLVTIGEVTEYKLEPKLDSDGCLILKRK